MPRALHALARCSCSPSRPAGSRGSRSRRSWPSAWPASAASRSLAAGPRKRPPGRSGTRPRRGRARSRRGWPRSAPTWPSSPSPRRWGASTRPRVRATGVGPVLWVSSSPTGLEGAAVAPGRPRLTSTFTLGAGGGPGAEEPTLQTEVEPVTLLSPEEADEGHTCRLLDATGTTLARRSDPGRPAPARESTVRAEANVGADGWSAPGPWRLECEQPEGLAVGRVEPVAARYRTTLTLNLAAVGLAALLGGFAVQQARRRERLEAQAREEARLRELERRLFHAERLTTVGRLAAGIAHEINNPLEGMANWLSLARTELNRGEFRVAGEHLEKVKEGLERAAGIVRQVLSQDRK